MRSGFASKAATVRVTVSSCKRGLSPLSVACLGALAGLFLCSSALSAADLSLPVTGNLLGSVVDGSGTPQMGASVQVLNKYEHLVAKAITAPDGRFQFAALPVDFYSIRVSLNSFLPASRDKIAVKAGLDSVLQIHLATLFSNIELSYSVPAAVMSDDWRWVLRSSSATRPITRLIDPSGTASSGERRPHFFSETRAMLMVSGGDGGTVDSDSIQGDLGTGFAVSTNVLGKSQLEIGGSLGQNANVGPAALGLFAIYRGASGSAARPEITLSYTQLGLLAPQFAGGPLNPSTPLTGGAPAIRSMAVTFYDVAEVGDLARVEYGMAAESVDYLQHRSRISPFARLSVNAGSQARVIAAYSNGGRPDALISHDSDAVASDGIGNSGENMLSDAMSTLSRLPQISDRDGRLQLQRTQSYEAGYEKTAGSRSYAVSAFYDDVSNGRINVAGDVSALDPGDLLWDGTSVTSTYNVGSYQRSGYLGSVDQRLGNDFDVEVAYGRMGGFSVDGSSLGPISGGQHSFLHDTTRNIASVNTHARIPLTKTKISADYGWTDSSTIVPRHYFMTQTAYVAPGLNICLRQPLPSFFGIPGHLEVTADLRNLLAQGYLPFNTGGGQRMLIVQSPRALRGGLNFIF